MAASRRIGNWAREWRPDWLAVLSGLLIAASAPPWDQSWLGFFSYVPYFFAISRAKSLKDAFRQSLWLSITMSLGVFFWVAFVLHEFGELPWPICVVMLFLFCLITEPQFLIFGPLRKWLTRDSRKPGAARGVALMLALGFLYTGLDWILPKLFTDTYGQIFYRFPDLRQAADIGGAPLLTFVVYEINEAIYGAIAAVRSRGEPSVWPALRKAAPQLLVAAALLGADWGYGAYRNNEIDRALAAPHDSVQMASIQGNIGDFDKLAAEHGISGAADRVVDTFTQLSDVALHETPRPEAVIWPETSYPSTFRTPQTANELARDQRVEEYVRTRSVPVLFGGYDHQNHLDYNAFFFLSPPTLGNPPTPASDAPEFQVYRKNVLLLFGEYIPGAETFKFIRDAFPQVGNFGRGKGPSVLLVPRAGGKPAVKVGPIICYEALFPNYILAAARKGSQLILNITNDSWFGPFGEPQLHLMLTTFRSIESRLPQLRTTNTGISALILPNGEIARRTPMDVATTMNVSVPLLKPMPTLMLLWGDWFGPTALALGALLAVLLVRGPKAVMTHD